MATLIVDYGMCNLGSVRRAFEECGANVVVSPDPKELEEADRIVLPGVGAFEQGMKNLKAQGWIEPLREAALEKKVPFLGICLGMQLLSEKGYEGAEVDGLGLIQGEVVKFAPINQERIPHIGWNEVCYSEGSQLFRGLESGTDFYFVHSYIFKVKNQSDAISTTPYAGSFVSAVGHKNIFGVQFHPEKSQKPGFKLIRNFLEI